MEIVPTFEPKLVIISARVTQTNTKLANFSWLYFPLFTAFRRQTL